MTITFPDATGTVGLVAGSTGQLVFNNAGAYSGLSGVTTDGTDITLTGRFISSLNGAASAPPGTFTGTWFTGGTATTTKPQVLIEPTGTTSTAWSTSGTGLGVNAPAGFTGRLLDLQLNGTSSLVVTSSGNLGVGKIPGNRLDVGGSSSFDHSAVDALNIFRDTVKVGDIGGSAGGAAFSLRSTPGKPIVFNIASAEALRITTAGVLQVADAGDITVGTTTGTKIGTATTQKLGFYNATPVVQPAAVADATDAATVITQLNDLLAKLRTLGIIAT
jgi:hypothetical protein